MCRRKKKQKTLLGEVGRCMQYKRLWGRFGPLKEACEERRGRTNEKGDGKVAQAGLKRNSGPDIGGRDNWGIGQ